jgi:hypothetical protein
VFGLQLFAQETLICGESQWMSYISQGLKCILRWFTTKGFYIEIFFYKEIYNKTHFYTYCRGTKMEADQNTVDIDVNNRENSSTI